MPETIKRFETSGNEGWLGQGVLARVTWKLIQTNVPSSRQCFHTWFTRPTYHDVTAGATTRPSPSAKPRQKSRAPAHVALQNQRPGTASQCTKCGPETACATCFGGVRVLAAWPPVCRALLRTSNSCNTLSDHFTHSFEPEFGSSERVTWERIFPQPRTINPRGMGDIIEGGVCINLV